MREKYLVGNWKMNQNLHEIKQFFQDFEHHLANFSPCHYWLAPQSIHLDRLVTKFSQQCEVGAQNCSQHGNGAHTGEVSPLSLVDIGAVFTLVGHSERRHNHGEDNSLLCQKVLAAIEAGLKVIYCVGESLSEREENRTEDMIRGQLTEGLKGLSCEKQEQLLIAYEPVWAIGTGRSATGEQVQNVHRLIRYILSSLGFAGEDIPLLYGGSVKPENIEGIISQKDVDGALVGGASLSGENFARMGDAFNLMNLPSKE